MTRFDESMIWNCPTDPGSSEPASDPSEGSEEGCQEFSEYDFGSCWNDPSDTAADSKNAFSLDHRHGSHLTRHRSFFLPLHYTPTYSYPLIVWLHNNGYNEHQIDQVMPHISLRNYIGVGVRGTRAADSIGHRFEWHQGPAAIAAAHEAVSQAIDEAVERFSVHRSRIMLAGYRDGGTMAMRIALREPHRFAGAVSLGGRIPQSGIRNVQQLRRRRLPMLWQWAKENAEYTEANLKRDCQLVMSIGGQVEVRQYPDETEMDTVVLRDLDDWIMRRIVSTSSVADSDRWATSPTAYSNN